MSIEHRRSILAFAILATFALGFDARAGDPPPDVRDGTQETVEHTPTLSKRAARYQARLPVGLKQHDIVHMGGIIQMNGIAHMNGIVQMNGIIQMSGQPQPFSLRTPAPLDDESCSCWNGIGSCKRSGDACEAAGGDLACTGTCAVDDPGPDMIRFQLAD